MSAGESKVPGVNRVIKLSSNEGAFGVPPGAQEAMPRCSRAAPLSGRRGDRAAPCPRRALRLDPEPIVCGAGSDDLIYQLALAYGGPGTELLMTEHGFSIYEIAGQYAGSRVIKTRERDLTADVDALLAAVSPATRTRVPRQPEQPDRQLLPQAEVERLRAGLPSEVLLVLDAAYAEYVDQPDYDPGIKLVDAGENTVMTRTFSKIFGLGGLRVGWCYAPPGSRGCAEPGARRRSMCPSPAQAAAVAALEEPGWIEKSRAHNTALPRPARR